MQKYKSTAAWVILLVALPWLASATRVETLRWSHDTPEDVDGFILHLGPSSQNYTSIQDLGKPTPVDEVFSFDLTVPEFQTLYVALVAYGDGFLDSFHSNEKVLLGLAPPPPPPLGGVWNEDFEDLELGNVIPFWFSTGPNNSLSEDDSIFRIDNLDGNQVLATSTTSNNFHSHYMGEGSAGWAEYQLSGRFRSDASAGSIGVTVYSQYPNEDGYYRLRSWSDSDFELEPHGSVAACAQSSLGVPPERNKWLRFRIQVSLVDGNNEVKAKIWTDDAVEPDWQATCVDPNPTYRAGTIGVWGGRAGNKYWDDLEVTPLNQELGPLPAPILLPAP